VAMDEDIARRLASLAYPPWPPPHVDRRGWNGVETSGLVERSGRGPEPALVTRADALGAVAATKATNRTMRMKHMAPDSI
jgi:hypothetical protein